MILPLDFSALKIDYISKTSAARLASAELSDSPFHAAKNPPDQV